MSPLGTAIFSLLLISGIITAGGYHAKLPVPAHVWYAGNALVCALFIAVEIRAFLKKRKEGDEKEERKD